ncbi:UBX domain-containing protein 11 isoform X9 [Orcinus orca]|uniref:UBX domain-containing protein 11 isoform X9 n=1 Tax=Orcinus orca TaxID=9733 RepID=UPI002111DA23|nr:UBX domain-containing protein 11 isoform X9 [Orcinus orca]
MSSPLASLGKTRRVPLHSEPVNPGRRDIKMYGNEDEVEVLNDAHGSEERISVPSCYGGIGAPVSRQVPVYHDSELMATMARKVQDLERQVKAQADEMLSKDQKIRALEELVETLQEHQGTVTLQRQEELETTCAQLQRQVGEMERFLGDYGLQWVGEPMHEEDSEDGERDWMTAKKFWKPGSRMTAEKFLNRLPKLVIRQGEVIDIRGPIRDTLKIQEIVVETPALAAERERSQESPESPVPALSTLRIKSENGEQAFLLLMRPEDTVGDVRTLLAQARWARGSAGVRSGALAPRPGLIRSSLSPGPWRPPPSRSSVRSRPQSTTMTLSRCRPRAWCPTPRCCFGRAGLRCPPPAPNKAPTPTPAALQGSLGRAAQQH